MDKQLFQKAFHGIGVHVNTATVFEGLDWEQAGEKPENCPHSVWETLIHMNYWQDFMLKTFKGESPKSPEHAAESWTDSPAPASEEEWNSAVSHFLKGLEEAEQGAKKELAEQDGEPEPTRAESLLSIALHNTYHAGQVVFARRMLGAWPPPSGGDTW